MASNHRRFWALEPSSQREWFGRLVRTLGSLLLLLLLWQVGAWLAQDVRLLPGPLPVMSEIWRLVVRGDMLRQQAITLARVGISFVLAMSLGTAIGIAMGSMRTLDEFGRPWLIVFLNLPALVLIVLCYIWIGLNEVAVVVAVALNKIPNVVVQIREGTRALDPDLLAMARSFRFGRWRVLRHVILPQLDPYLLAASRSGLALIWKIVLIVELLGRSNGVGFEIGTRFQLFDVAGILAYALAFIAIVQLIEWCCLMPWDRRVSAWRK